MTSKEKEICKNLVLRKLKQNKVIKEYIDFFKQYDKENVLIDTFTKGYCYQFAVILNDRFGGEIFYEPIEGHFVTKINCKYWDIRGDVTSLYKDKELYSKEIYLRIDSIVKGCILKDLYGED